MPVISTVKRGNDLVLTIQLTFDGSTKDITGATVTATLRDGEHPKTVLDSAHVVVITTPTTSLVTLTYTDTELAAIPTPPDFRTAMNHILDVKVVETGDAVTNSDTITIPFVRQIT